MTAPTPTRPVGVDELRKAWHAVQDGQFRARSARDQVPSAPTAPTSPDLSQPPSRTAQEVTLPVIGCAGQAGTSTTALAIATAAGAARLIECCTATASGLTAAAAAELGVTESGWALGRRGDVLIARTTAVLVGLDQMPPPDPAGPDVTTSVLDIGWELAQVLATPGWVNEQLTQAPHIVAVSIASVPGMRRLETALTLLGHTHVVAAVLGPGRRRWPCGVEAAMEPRTRAIRRSGDLVQIPTDKQLAVRGLDATPLPPRLLAAAATVLRRTGAAPPQQKGHL